MTSRSNHSADRPIDFDELLSDPSVAEAAKDAEQRYDLLEALAGSRRTAGKTQKEVARLMETTQSAVSDFESGRTDPQLSTVQRYARAVDARIRIVVEDLVVARPGCETTRDTARISVSTTRSEFLATGYFATYAECGTAGRRSNYAKAA